MKKEKNKKWVKPRHVFSTALIRLILAPVIKFKYHAKIEKFKEQGKRPYLVLLNHQTAFDQFFVGTAFKGAVYYVATEDLLSKGWVSKVINYLVAPIPIKKQTTDMRAVMTCAKVAKEGGTIALAPEGNRTYCGRTLEFKKSVVKLAKLTKLPLAFFKIEGGYGVQPRWSDTIRKGKMRAYVAKVIEYDDYKNLSDDELYDIIKENLWQDESSGAEQYHGKRLAERLERALYVCNDCGLSEFHSKGDIIACKKCGKKIRYATDKSLVGINCVFPFNSVAEWYDYQKAFINGLDLSKYHTFPAYTDQARFSEVILYKNKKLLEKKANISLYGNRITVSGKKTNLTFNFNELSTVTVLGKNKVNLYHGEKVYQIKGSKSFNALRFVNFFHKHLNIKENNQDGFLGL